VVTIGGLAALALGPAAPWLVGVVAEDRAVWRLGRLHLEGIAGSGIDDLRVDRLTLSDEEGLWLEASDVQLAWSPLRLLSGEVVIERVVAEEIDILRQPILSAPKPPSGGSIDVDLASLQVARLQLAEPLAGEAAAFRMDGALNAADQAVLTAQLSAVRLDAPGDALQLRYDRDAVTILEARLEGGSDGFFAAMLSASLSVTPGRYAISSLGCVS
jgi:translocation and assembly module TamB